MELYELNLNQLIEVKLLRLNKPKFNSQLIPLSGSYNSIEDLQKLEEALPDSQIDKKFKEFFLHESSSVSIDNMFQLSSSFGKVLFCESLEALLIINNTSDREIKIKDFKVRVSNEVLEGYDSMYRKTEYNLIHSQNLIAIPGNQYHNQKIRLNADIMCKYALEIDVQYTSPYFTEEFIKHSANKIVKTISSQYSVEGNSSTVIRKYYKKFLFATNLPFKIKEKFINDNLNTCYVEINLINQSPYILHITDMVLVPDTEKSYQQGNFITALQESEIKNFNIEPDEEINAVFVLNNYKSSIANNAYIFKVCWRNSFDSLNKFINYVIKNRLNTFNDIFSIYLVEKPSAICIDEHFKIVFQLKNKTSKGLKLKISKEKQTEKEVEVIDIAEKDVDLLDKATFSLICKSEFLGSVFLPRLIITEESSKKALYFDKLLNFNCVNKITLI